MECTEHTETHRHQRVRGFQRAVRNLTVSPATVLLPHPCAQLALTSPGQEMVGALSISAAGNEFLWETNILAILSSETVNN